MPPLHIASGGVTFDAASTILFPNKPQIDPSVTTSRLHSPYLTKNGPTNITTDPVAQNKASVNSSPTQTAFVDVTRSHDQSEDEHDGVMQTSFRCGPAPISKKLLEIRDTARFLVNVPSWFGRITPVSHLSEHLDFEYSEQYCNARIRRNLQRCLSKAKKSHPAGFLPMCYKHANNRLLAGRCRHVDSFTGEACNDLFHWIPPYFELCRKHKDWDGFPCYIMDLPCEVRDMILDYLFPNYVKPPARKSFYTNGEIPRNMSILRVNKQIYAEARQIVYKNIHFRVSLSTKGFEIRGKTHKLPEYNGLTSLGQNGQWTDFELPTYLKYARHLDIQIIHGKQPHHGPGFPPFRRDEEVRVYDTQDAIRAFCWSLKSTWSRKSREEMNSEFNLKSLAVCLVTQGAPDTRNDDIWGEQYKVIMSPLKLLFNIGQAEIRHIHLLGPEIAPLDIPCRHYIPDVLIPLEDAKKKTRYPGEMEQRLRTDTDLDVASASNRGVFAFEDFYRHGFPGRPTFAITPGFGTSEYNEFNQSTVEALKSPEPHDYPHQAADTAFVRFHNICARVSMLNLMPCEYVARRNSVRCLWHQCRVAREKGDAQTILELGCLVYQSAESNLAKEVSTLTRKCQGMAVLNEEMSALQAEPTNSSKRKQVDYTEVAEDTFFDGDPGPSTKRAKMS